MDTIYIVLILLLSILIFLSLLIVFLLSKKKTNGEALEKNFRNISDDLDRGLKNTREEINTILGNRIEKFSQTNEQKLENIRKSVEDKLYAIQRDNAEKLETMRATVDEKLHNTLEKRLGESFKLVNDRLESVYKGLGEMQTLAVGVGDLKKVLSNVKVRGSWGEIQLGNILEEYLTTDQYTKNAKTKPRSKEFVEFAIKIPEKTEDGKFVLLPIDSKYPVEDYNRLIEAEETGDANAVISARKSLISSIKKCAMDIRDKYVNPPTTTDFGVMFLPTESLYCEVLRNSSLAETLRRDYKVTVTGPTTLAAFINTLQVGFHAFAIEKRTSQVWEILDGVKKEFDNFGTILEKTNKKIQEVANTMKEAESKTRKIQSKLGKVSNLSFIPTTSPIDIADSVQIDKPDDEN
ncbi:MAG: DNA recombination protein RmuC [Clostridia bacterium]|nr:DNA recombination protein RmuC [Clostridia bacterium]